MKKTTGVMLTVCLGVALSVPAFAATKSSTSTPAATATVPVSSSTPATPAAASATPPATAPVAPAEAASSATVKAGSLEISHTHLTASGDHIDVFLTVKNNGKGDERIIGGGSTWQTGDVVQVSKGADGKEKEDAAAIGIPAGKTTELDKDTIWLRVKNVTTPKNASVFPITLYFRSAPNTELKISFKSSGGIMDWFSK